MISVSMTTPSSTLSQAQSLAHAAISHGVARLSASQISFEVIPPKESGHGVLACPVAFTLASTLKRSPMHIAAEIAQFANEYLQSTSASSPALLSHALAEAGYVNFIASNAFYASIIQEACEKGTAFGDSTTNSRKVIIEFSQPNVGKPFHIGHIRSTILGDSVVRLLRTQGAAPVAFNYLGDAGAQVAKLVVALEAFKDIPKAVDEKTLLTYYTRIHKEIEANPELNERTRQVMEHIENADASTLEVVEKIRELSMQAFNRNYQMLDVAFDEVTGESRFIEEGRKRVDECIEKGIAVKEKDGSVVANLEPHGLPNTILLRSNGTTLYLTRDIALADYKYEKYAFDQSMIFTASEQNMHFRQLQKIVSLLGRPYAQQYKHTGFGLVFLQSGRLSTREGNVVFLEDVLNEAIAAAKTELLSRNVAYPEKEIDEIARMVGIGSTKFAFIRVSSERNITFDPHASTRFEGDTGAYVQYTCVRANNILRKLSEKQGERIIVTQPVSHAYEWSEQEKHLAQSIARFPAVLHNAAQGYQPHVVCEYLLRLSADFSSFYEAHPVLLAETDQQKHVRSMLVQATALTLHKGLSVLGIHVPQRM